MALDDVSSEPRAPEKLLKKMGELYAAPFAVPPEVDRAVLARARFHFVRARQQRVRWMAAAAAVAAGLLLSICISMLAPRAAAPRLQTAAAREDFNLDGRVDILDAFALARKAGAGGVSERRWDLDGNGVVDRRDADAIAMAAVRIDARRVRW